MFYCSFVSIHYIICECGETFPTEESLKEHLEKDHHKKRVTIEQNEFKCETCGKVFTSARACLIHQQVHTVPHPKRVFVPKVKLPQRDPRELREPRELRDPREIRNLRESRELRDKWDQHKKKSYNIKNIVCEVCGKRYASKAALGYHQRVHTGERPYHCSLCPKTFTMPLFLQIHTRTHTGERPYQCPQCPKAFSNKAALLRHDRVHTGIKPYACPRCGKTFTQSNSMKLHVKTVHLKQPAPYKSKNRRNKQLQNAANRMAMRAQNAAREEDDGSASPPMEVEVQMLPVKAEVVMDEDTYQMYDGEVYEEGAELYQEVETGHPEITMYEVQDEETGTTYQVAEDGEVLYKVEDLKEEILYQIEEEQPEVLYEDGDGQVLYEEGEAAEILYEGDDREEVLYEEVYEEAV